MCCSHGRIYIEGAFHVTSAWLNGAFLGEHKSGYNSFWLRLDALANTTGAAPRAVWGGENVLALHVDATSGTGRSRFCRGLFSI